jgi:ParB-like chromosome segregation protein Spo0J
MNIEEVAVQDIVPYEKNPKEHPQAQIKKLASIIREYGFLVPVLIDKSNVIISGHCRYEASKVLGLEVVPVIRAEHLTETQIKAFRIADNRIAESGWSEDLLLDELNQLKDLNFDINLTGFSVADLDKMIERAARETERPEVEFTQELLLEHNYIVLYFSNPLDWQVAVEKFGLKKVKDLVPRRNAPIGVGRILRGAEWLDRIS